MSWFATLSWSIAAAQSPHDPWRTARTEHFVVHYPLVAEDWALPAIGRLEELHARVTAEVGFEPEGRWLVRVVDPFGLANGSTFPFLNHGRIELWATPPEASSVIGHYRSWSELLVVHEDTHLVHLLRPSRNPLRSSLDRFTGFGPLTTGCPRWVVEGYATVVEGRLTGLGRPNGDLRPTLLRGLAVRGELPTYDALDGNGRFLGGADAYLIGSAFLEWLEARAGEGSLRSLWRRMSARELRSFDEAFRGVFGDPPRELYGRFTAELTADAMALARAAPPSPGTLFESATGPLDPPALSADGTRLALIGSSDEDGFVVRILSTAVDQEAVDRRQESIAEALQRDPDDVAPVDPAHPPHEVLHTHHSRAVPLRDVRFVPDGASLIWSAGLRDGSGRLRWDLVRWWPETGRVRRLTRGADVRAADPEPDGRSAIAVQQDWGETRLVRVDLETGEVTPLVGPGDTFSVDGPRISPDGGTLAWLEARPEGFGTVVQDRATGAVVHLSPNAAGGVTSQLAFAPDGALYAVQGDAGRLDVVELWRDGAPSGARVGTLESGVVGLEVGLDELYVLTLGTRGNDVHRLPRVGEVQEPPSEPSVLSRPERPEAPPLPDVQAVAPGRYGLGTVEVQPLFGFGLASPADTVQLEVGARLGDPIGRDELLLIAGLGAGRSGVTGGRASFTSRALPVALTADGWVGGDQALGTRRGGLVVAAELGSTGPSTRARLTVGGLLDRPLAGDLHGDRDLGVATGRLSWFEPRSAVFGAWVDGEVAAGALDRAEALSASGTVGLGVARGAAASSVSWTVGRSTASGLGGFLLGGLPDTVIPDLAEGYRVEAPAFAPGVVRGTAHDRVRLEVGRPLSVFVERHRFAEEGWPGPEGSSAAGVQLEQRGSAAPFLRFPAVRASAGLACRFEGPGLGVDPRPCLSVADWAGWASLVFLGGTDR